MSYITGPAALKIGTGPYLYSEAGFTVKLVSKTGQVATDFHGELGKFLVSRKAVVTGRAVAVLTGELLASLFPTVEIGSSLAGQNIEIWTRAGQKITWQRGGVTKVPELTFSATRPLFSGDLEITCLGGNAIADANFSENSFAPGLIRRYRYTAACGNAPYDSITAQEGFKVAIGQEVGELEDDNVGIADLLLKSLTATCSFVPSNLSEAQVWSLAQLQGGSAFQPGDLFTGQDLIISGSDANSHLTFTLSQPGFHDAATAYGTGKLRTGEMVASAARTFTGGTADPLFTFAQG